MKEVFTFGRYLRQKFGESVYKVPVSLPGFTCPNIDGSVAFGGCTFCENESFSPNLTTSAKPKFTLTKTSLENPLLQTQLQALDLQYGATAKRLSKKFGAKKFLVYFQSFSNTYAPLETLRTLYEKALALNDAIGISVGTRTDCIDTRLLEYLSDLADKSEVWVEYGIQSFFDETLRRINRGHDASNIVEGLKATKKHGLNTCGHLIFGLPGETSQMMLENFDRAITLGVDSLKIHPLYVVKNTALAASVKAGTFEPISEELFLELLVECIRRLPSDVSIQRITAGVSDDSLIAPSWCGNKHTQMKHATCALAAAGFKY